MKLVSLSRGLLFLCLFFTFTRLSAQSDGLPRGTDALYACVSAAVSQGRRSFAIHSLAHSRTATFNRLVITGIQRDSTIIEDPAFRLIFAP